jgi:Icc-related predicted phosphoesterase
MMGTEKEVGKFASWFGNSTIEAKHRIFVPGNHDWLFQKDQKKALDILDDVADESIIVLDQDFVVVEGLGIYGEPRQPIFFDWAFNEEREDMEQVWDLVPAGVDILVTHGPPLGYGDMTVRGERVGCGYQIKLLEEFDIKLVVCGHIHNDYGVHLCGSTIIANASICNENYNPVNNPLVIDL